MAPEPLWMRTDSFPIAPVDGSYGFLIGRWRRRIELPLLAGRLSRNALGLSPLIWTPVSKRALPIWDHQIFISNAWKAGRRFWFGLSILAALLLGYTTHSLVVASATVGDWIDSIGSAAIFAFCVWQVHLSYQRSPSYLESARTWGRYNAWCRLNSGMWAELLVGALLLVFACQFYGLRSPEGNGIATRTLKLAAGSDAVIAGHQWWRLLTAPVIHGTPEHLITNIIWLLFFARWMQGVVPRATLPFVLCFSAWIGTGFGLVGATQFPGVGLSTGLSGITAFLVVVWLRTNSLPPWMGSALLLWTISGWITEFLEIPATAAGHAGGFLIGFILGMLLVRPGAQLPITTNRFVNFAGHACGVIMLALCILVSLNLSNVSWAQW